MDEVYLTILSTIIIQSYLGTIIDLLPRVKYCDMNDQITSLTTRAKDLNLREILVCIGKQTLLEAVPFDVICKFHNSPSFIQWIQYPISTILKSVRPSTLLHLDDRVNYFTGDVMSAYSILLLYHDKLMLEWRLHPTNIDPNDVYSLTSAMLWIGNNYSLTDSEIYLADTE